MTDNPHYQTLLINPLQSQFKHSKKSICDKIDCACLIFLLQSGFGAKRGF